MVNEFHGTVERIVYRSPDGGYTVARVQGEKDSATLVGDLQGIVEGDVVRATGEFQDHPRFGRQLKVSQIVPALPTSRRGVERYLASGVIPGIGKTLAERIVKHLGEEALERIAADPGALKGVSGIGDKRAKDISKAIADRKESQETLVFLQGLGIGPALVGKVHRAFGGDAIRLIRENPYRLAEKLHGVGFHTADRIARELGIEQGSVQRAEAALMHVLGEASGAGHCFLPETELFERTTELLGAIEGAPLEEARDGLEERKKIVREVRPGAEEGEDPPFVIYRDRLHFAESRTASLLAELQDRQRERSLAPAGFVEELARKADFVLGSEQSEALEMAVHSPVCVITGGPGVGKTTILRLLTQVAAASGAELALASPTGRASRRLAEATGHEASTLHRLLRFDPHTGRFGVDREDPLEQDLVVVDEVSMMDVVLAYHLLRGIRSPTRLVLVGDADQLPSVGPGCVLRDLIRSGTIPVARLTRIYRQAERSSIVMGAHSVLRGNMPAFPQRGEESDLYLFRRETPEEVAQTVVELVTSKLPQKFGLDPDRDIQVLTPMYRGPAGVDELNEKLREKRRTQESTGLKVGRHVYRKGDKVIQLRNDYDKEVFNGDVGYVADVASEARRVLVDFDGRAVEYTGASFDDLSPAFAITVHRAQGSEYPAVIVVLSSDHYIMLRRNLVYTAMTRGRRLVVLVGSQRALGKAIRTIEGDDRYTALAERLRRAR